MNQKEKHEKGECCKCSYCCEPCYNEKMNNELMELEPNLYEKNN